MTLRVNYVSIKLLFFKCLPYSSSHLIEVIFSYQCLSSYFRNPEQGAEWMVFMTERTNKGNEIDLKYRECAEGWEEVESLLEGMAVKAFKGKRKRQNSPTFNYAGSQPGSSFTFCAGITADACSGISNCPGEIMMYDY